MKKLSIPVILLCLGLATVASGATGQIKFERWNGITGTAVNNLTDNAAYPDNPSEVTFVNRFEADPTPDPSDYGGRLIGWLIPPVTGQYTFWLASDDSGQLWLSPDTNHDHAFQIASISGYSGINEWNKYASQQSGLLTLQAGRPYAVYALWKEGGGGDHVAVSWGSADAGIPDYTVIEGQYLAAELSLADAPLPPDDTVDTPVSPGAPLDAELRWVSSAPEGTEFTVRFGTVDPNQGPTAPELDIYTTTDTRVDPGPLEYDTKYYWRVEASVDANDFVGPTWTFETISRGPYILSNPSSVAVAPGEEAEFTAEIDSIAGVSYQWYREEAPDDIALSEGAKFAGVNTTTLTIMDVDQDDAGSYYLVATSEGLRPAQTDSAALTVAVKQRLAYYPLDGSGDDAEGIHDLSPTGTVAYVDGIVGQAASFDGAGGFLAETGTDIGADLLNGLPALSISVWVKSNQINTDRGFIIFEAPAGNDDYDLRYDSAGATGGGDDVLKIGITTTEDILQVETGEDTQTTEWQHVVLTWQTGEPLRVYLDGAFADPTASDPAVDAVLEGFGQLRVGLGGNANQDPPQSWDGLVDEIEIFSYALSPLEIAQMYVDGSGQSVCIEAPEFDLDGDCVVDVDDLVMMITESWMECNLVPDCLP